jgi:hypothetical protein
VATNLLKVDFDRDVNYKYITIQIGGNGIFLVSGANLLLLKTDAIQKALEFKYLGVRRTKDGIFAYRHVADRSNKMFGVMHSIGHGSGWLVSKH